jgi:alkylation response protein AidB-like acyl-CoA dehydrogenase
MGPQNVVHTEVQSRLATLHAATRRFTASLISHTGLVPAGEAIVYLEIDSKIIQIYEGTNQMQRVVMARKLLSGNINI